MENTRSRVSEGELSQGKKPAESEDSIKKCHDDRIENNSPEKEHSSQSKRKEERTLGDSNNLIVVKEEFTPMAYIKKGAMV